MSHPAAFGLRRVLYYSLGEFVRVVDDGLEGVGQPLDLLPQLLHVRRLVADQLAQVEGQDGVQDGEHLVRSAQHPQWIQYYSNM